MVVDGTVRNSCDRDGADVIQVYADVPDADVPARLVGFARVEVRAGTHMPFRVTVPVDRLAVRDAERHAWRPATGRHRISVGRFALDPDGATADVDL